LLISSTPTKRPIPDTAPLLSVRMVHEGFGRGRQTVQNSNETILKMKQTYEKAKNIVNRPNKDRYEEREDKERNKEKTGRGMLTQQAEDRMISVMSFWDERKKS
jgi:hypothetical protein